MRAKGSWKIPWTEGFLLGKSLLGCGPWGIEELDTTERLHFHFSLSCTGEGNGNPLRYSCLKNPRDRGAWWAAVYGVAQSRTRLKWLSSKGALLVKNFSQVRTFQSVSLGLVCISVDQSVPICLSTSRLQSRHEDATHSNTGSKIKSVKFLKATEKYLVNTRLLIKS